jgi:hypothetical protein
MVHNADEGIREITSVPLLCSSQYPKNLGINP